MCKVAHAPLLNARYCKGELTTRIRRISEWSYLNVDKGDVEIRGISRIPARIHFLSDFFLSQQLPNPTLGCEREPPHRIFRKKSELLPAIGAACRVY